MKEQQKIVSITDRKTIPFSKAMQTRLEHLNVKALAMKAAADELGSSAQRAGNDVKDYLTYCREELDAPAEKYDLHRIDVGFERKKEKNTKEGLDGIH